MAASAFFLCSCKPEVTESEEPVVTPPQVIGKTISHSGRAYNIQDVLTVKDGNVKVQEVGKSSTGYSYEDIITGNRKGQVIKPPDIFIKGFSKTTGEYPHLFWNCHEDWWGYGLGSKMLSIDPKKMGDKTYEIWRVGGKTASVLKWQQHPHKWSGVNNKGELSGKDEWGIGSINYSFEGKKFRDQAGVKAFWKVLSNATTIELTYVKPETSESYYAKWNLPKSLKELKPELDDACNALGVEKVALESK